MSDKDDKSGTKLVRSVTVDCEPQAAYSYWRDLQNLPRIMTYVDSVRETESGRTHWVVRGPAGVAVEWDADIIWDEPNRSIAWRSVGSTKFENSGLVRFRLASGKPGTIIRVEMEYDPAGGAFTNAVSKLLGVDVGMKISHDLRNFKQLMEVGEVTQSDASIHRDKHPARPPKEQYRLVA
jgi:uncharacterized membrane protein